MLGFLNIDKPTGITSHDVIYRVRKVAQIRKVGHAGTLDPLATGVLVVAIGRATRLIEYVMGQPKTYVTQVRLGQTTNTYDADGEVVRERSAESITDAQIEDALGQFRGTIEQVPPMYSAIKKNGQPLYKLARKGEIIDIPPRTVTIDTLEFVERANSLLTLRIGCSTGTYIRSLAHDLGEALGCGGHVTMLRREAVGRFDAAHAIPLNDLTPETLQANLLPVEQAIAHLPRIDLTERQAELLGYGIRIEQEEGHPLAEIAASFTPDNRFYGILEPRGGRWHPRKLFT